ncbi:hypothetical protein TRVA0_061S00386 [Trichomonascus vanleenenianus]|uniref:uncharacterized protein n=1 Tax=Trichomonascus vanleenenianus TaxID=2268995 RepID=UPI003ECA77F0
MTAEKRPYISSSGAREAKHRNVTTKKSDGDALLTSGNKGSSPVGPEIGRASTPIASFKSLRQEIKSLLKHYSKSLPVLKSVMDGGIAMTNGNELANDDSPAKSPVTAQWAVKKFVGTLKTYAVIRNHDDDWKTSFQTVFHCQNGCMAYTGQYKLLTNCLKCGTEKSTLHYYYYFSIRETIRAIFDDKDSAGKFRSECEKLYGSKRIAEPGTYTDCWSGKRFDALKNTPITAAHSIKKLDHNGNYFDPDSIEISVTMMADSINPWSNRQAELFTIVLINNNLPYEQRFLDENVLIPMAFPKPTSSDSSDIMMDQTFLTPLIDDFAEMSRGFKVFDAKSRKKVTIKVHLTQVSADMPACDFVMNMTGESGTKPCRACYATNDGSSRGAGTLFAEKIHLRTLRQHESEARRSDDLRKDNSPELANHIRETGVEGCAEIFRLSSIAMPWSFVPDLMHLLYANLGRQMFEILRNALTLEEQLKLDGVLEMLNNNLPISVGGTDLPLEFFTKGKTWNANAFIWKIMCKLAPYFLSHISRDPGTITIEIISLFKEFFLLVDKLSDMEMTTIELDQMDQFLAKFRGVFQKMALNLNDPETYNIFMLPMHSLRHLKDYIEQNGCLRYYWCFPLERACNAVKSKGIPCRYPLSGIQNKLTLRYMDQLVPFEATTSSSGRSEKYIHPESQFGTMLSNISQPLGSLIEKPLVKNTLSYINRTIVPIKAYGIYTIDGKEKRNMIRLLNPPTSSDIRVYSRIKLPSGEIIGSACSHENNDCSAAVVRDNNGDLFYGRCDYLLEVQARLRTQNDKGEKLTFKKYATEQPLLFGIFSIFQDPSDSPIVENGCYSEERMNPDRIIVPTSSICGRVYKLPLPGRVHKGLSDSMFYPLVSEAARTKKLAKYSWDV